MDVSEVEENLFVASDAKLHGEMCKILSAIYCKIISIFPSLEAARPRSKSGIQALCSLHVALEKAKNVLQHCSTSSKLYLAITGDSVLSKFEKAKCALIDSLRRVEDIVPQSIGCLILEIVSELEGTVFSLDASEKQVGDEMITILQHGRNFDEALTERRALKKLMERARAEEDKRKESIVAYLLHLMRKYSKLFRSEVSDDNDSQGSTPCSPTVLGSLEDGGDAGNGQAFERHLSKLSSFNFKPNIRRFGQMSLPPEELRCPISLQLMYDPVIIASGQTYERICIEKWFGDGHVTCPKTQQKLPHLSLTPNYCVKGLIASWCEQNGLPNPDGPPESLDLYYWRLALSESETANSRSVNSVSSCNLKGVKVSPLEESGTIEEVEGNEAYEHPCPREEVYEVNVLERYQDLLYVLNEEENMRKRCKVVEQIRILLKDDEEARIFMGANGFVEGLLRFLESAVHEGNAMAQETGVMALFNLAVNNNRNKELMVAAGVILLLEDMLSNSNANESATALYLNLSCLEQAKSIIGLSKAVPFLVQLLGDDTNLQCKLDALHTLYNLSTVHSNIPSLLSAGIVNSLQPLVVSGDQAWTEKSIAVLLNLASSQAGKSEIISASGLISGLAYVLDAGELIEQEQAVTCLLLLCIEDDKCSQMVLQEGVIPALVSISVNGTTRGRKKSQKLLMLFREQRQRDHLADHQMQQTQEHKIGDEWTAFIDNLNKSLPLFVLILRSIWTTAQGNEQCKSGRLSISILEAKYISGYDVSIRKRLTSPVNKGGDPSRFNRSRRGMDGEEKLAPEGNTTLKNHLTKSCKALRSRSDPSQSNLTPQDGVFVYDNEKLREVFTKFMIIKTLPFDHFDVEDFTTTIQQLMQPRYTQSLKVWIFLAWWKENEAQFPILAAMARDLLTVQASTVASESVFSVSGKVISQRRSRLSPESVEICICLKDYLDGAARKQHITTLEDAIDADLEANLHIEEVELGISTPNEEGEDDEEDMTM
ncbi:U-box domain-containing protein 7 [Hibiscus syriacus]|uniref:RING-type E3 ubiquitin transferase n=1 Tax=Hibiscus syriacus TaxID=106335 RepID=A0A6A2ZYM6_HIBSY|nr:U-box domain-containing protein 7 [Hibiscus syriacus]